MRITGLLLLLAATPAFGAPKFPFIEAMKRLDSTEKKLEHLRGWQSGLAKENGNSKKSVRVQHYGILEDALEAVQKYFAAADSDHGNYRSALKLREAIQEKMRE